jgi:hypothetical protein
MGRCGLDWYSWGYGPVGGSCENGNKPSGFKEVRNFLTSWVTISFSRNTLLQGVRVKVKLSLCLTKPHAMKTCWESGGIVPHILDLGTRWRWVVSFMPWPLYPQGKSTWYPLDRRLGGPQSHFGHGAQEKNSQLPLGIEPILSLIINVLLTFFLD